MMLQLPWLLLLLLVLSAPPHHTTQLGPGEGGDGVCVSHTNITTTKIVVEPVTTYRLEYKRCGGPYSFWLKCRSYTAHHSTRTKLVYVIETKKVLSCCDGSTRVLDKCIRNSSGDLLVTSTLSPSVHASDRVTPTSHLTDGVTSPLKSVSSLAPSYSSILWHDSSSTWSTTTLSDMQLTKTFVPPSTSSRMPGPSSTGRAQPWDIVTHTTSTSPHHVLSTSPLELQSMVLTSSHTLSSWSATSMASPLLPSSVAPGASTYLLTSPVTLLLTPSSKVRTTLPTSTSIYPSTSIDKQSDLIYEISSLSATTYLSSPLVTTLPFNGEPSALHNITHVEPSTPPHTTMIEPSTPPHTTMIEPATPPHTPMIEPTTPTHTTMIEPTTPPHTTMIEPTTPPHTTMIEPTTPSHTTMIEPATPPHTTMIEPATPPHTTMIESTTPPHTPMIEPTTPPHTTMIEPATPPHTTMIETATPTHTTVIKSAKSTYTTMIEPTTLPYSTSTQTTTPKFEEGFAPLQYLLDREITCSSTNLFYIGELAVYECGGLRVDGLRLPNGITCKSSWVPALPDVTSKHFNLRTDFLQFCNSLFNGILLDSDQAFDYVMGEFICAWPEENRIQWFEGWQTAVKDAGYVNNLRCIIERNKLRTF